MSSSLKRGRAGEVAQSLLMARLLLNAPLTQQAGEDARFACLLSPLPALPPCFYRLRMMVVGIILISIFNVRRYNPATSIFEDDTGAMTRLLILRAMRSCFAMK